MKVYDCFTFYNEFETLELRLKNLYDVVDYFVLVEADKTHSNQKKPFYFNENKDRFKEFLPKIRHLMVNMNLPFKGAGDWVIENSQRNMIARGIQDAAPDDLIVISDLDEIWAPDVLYRIINRQAVLYAHYVVPDILTPPRPGKPRFGVPCQLMADAIDVLENMSIGTELSLHNYYFDYQASYTWHGSVFTKFKNFTTPQHLRNLRVALPYIKDGGYHFSYMGGAERVIKKRVSIVQEYDNEINGRNLLDKKIVKEDLANGLISWDPDPEKARLHPFDVNQIRLPYIKEFLKKYPQFLRATDPGLN